MLFDSFKFKIDQKVWYIQNDEFVGGVVVSRKLVDAPDTEPYKTLSFKNGDFLKEGHHLGASCERYELFSEHGITVRNVDVIYNQLDFLKKIAKEFNVAITTASQRPNTFWEKW